MKICSIFVGKQGENGIWSIQLHGESQNEFDRFFDSIGDIEWLYRFFEEHEADLESGYFGDIDIEEAAMRTRNEGMVVRKTLYQFAEGGFNGRRITLQHVFRPLNNFEYSLVSLQLSKARVDDGWLRVYAIRLAENCYLITGGAIKLTPYMDREHLLHELRKLEIAKRFLRLNGIEFPEDLNFLK